MDRSSITTTTTTATSTPSSDHAHISQAPDARIAELEAECRRLALSEQYYRSLIEHTADVVIVLSRTGAIAYSSPAAERMLGVSPSELSGADMRTLIHPDDLPRALRAVEQFLGSPGASIMREFRLRRKDGSWRHVEASASNLLLDPAISGIVVTVHDTTERVRMEAFFRSSLVEKETLLKEIHHRVKNNLQLISSMLGLQAHHIEDEQVARIFRESKDRIRSMALIHEQLYESKNLAGIGLAGYVTTLVRHLIGSHTLSSGAVRFTHKVGALTLDIDRMIYFGLLVNEVVTNSLKHAFPDGRQGEIHVEAREDTSSITVTISDTGIGIKREPADKAGSRPTLGLELVSMLASQLEGTITMDTGSHGTAFTLIIPKVQQA